WHGARARLAIPDALDELDASMAQHAALLLSERAVEALAIAEAAYRVRAALDVDLALEALGAWCEALAILGRDAELLRVANELASRAEEMGSVRWMREAWLYRERTDVATLERLAADDKPAPGPA